jgi:hypothetical protein
MSIDVVARKFLWSNAGNQCAFPDCFQSLTVIPPGEAGDVAMKAGILIGEEAHIRSRRPQGPRFDKNYPVEEVDGYSNLILLCPTHHRMIDKNGGARYTVEALLTVKTDHERQVASKMSSGDKNILELAQRTAVSLGIWERRIQLDGWQNFTYGLNMPIPRTYEKDLQRLGQLSEWLLKKKWSHEYPRIVTAFDNLRRAIADLYSFLTNSMEPSGSSGRLMMEQETKQLETWDPPEYERRRLRDDKRIAIICALSIETTKAINYAIDGVVSDLDPYYRFDEGICLLGRGDGLTREVHRLEYTQGRIDGGSLYPGHRYIKNFVNDLVEADPDEHSFDQLFHLCESSDQLPAD